MIMWGDVAYKCIQGCLSPQPPWGDLMMKYLWRYGGVFNLKKEWHISEKIFLSSALAKKTSQKQSRGCKSASCWEDERRKERVPLRMETKWLHQREVCPDERTWCMRYKTRINTRLCDVPQGVPFYPGHKLIYNLVVLKVWGALP